MTKSDTLKMIGAVSGMWAKHHGHIEKAIRDYADGKISADTVKDCLLPYELGLETANGAAAVMMAQIRSEKAKRVGSGK